MGADDGVPGEKHRRIDGEHLAERTHGKLGPPDLDEDPARRVECLDGVGRYGQRTVELRRRVSSMPTST